MVVGNSQDGKRVELGKMRCPCCNVVGRLRPHSPYWRWVEDLDERGNVVREREVVERVKCDACGRTHAILPSNIVPFCRRTLRLQVAIAEERLSGSTVESVCERFHVDPRTLYRIMDRLQALLEALKHAADARDTSDDELAAKALLEAQEADKAEVCHAAASCGHFRAVLARAHARTIGRGPLQGPSANRGWKRADGKLDNVARVGPCALGAYT